MLIQCTKKLLDELKVTPVEAEETDPLLSWHANAMKIDRHKFLVLVNDKNRYGIVLYGLKAKDKKNLVQLLRKAIHEVFRSEAIDEEVITEYLSLLSHLTFAKTKNRTLVARLNKQCENVLFGEDYLDIDSIVQVAMSKLISSLLAGDGKGGYFHPNEAMYRDLLELKGI